MTQGEKPPEYYYSEEYLLMHLENIALKNNDLELMKFTLDRINRLHFPVSQRLSDAIRKEESDEQKKS